MNPSQPSFWSAKTKWFHLHDQLCIKTLCTISNKPECVTCTCFFLFYWQWCNHCSSHSFLGLVWNVWSVEEIWRIWTLQEILLCTLLEQRDAFLGFLWILQRFWRKTNMRSNLMEIFLFLLSKAILSQSSCIFLVKFPNGHLEQFTILVVSFHVGTSIPTVFLFPCSKRVSWNYTLIVNKTELQ